MGIYSPASNGISDSIQRDLYEENQYGTAYLVVLYRQDISRDLQPRYGYDSMHSYKECLHHVRQAKTLSTSWEMSTYHDRPRRLCMIMSAYM